MEWVGGVSVAAVVVAAVVGALVGSVMGVLAWRVPRGVPLRAGRPTGGPGRAGMWADVPFLRLRTGGGRSPAEAGVAVRPPVLEVVTGALFAVMVARFGVSWVLPAYLVLAAAAVLLAVVDLQHQRLPNAIVGPFAGAALVLLTVASAGQGAWEPLLRAVIGAAALFLLYLVLALISPASLGMGDVKLAAVLGLYLAYLSWRAWVLGAVGGFVITALAGVVLLITRRADRRTQIPFGPSMLLAALLAVVAAAP